MMMYGTPGSGSGSHHMIHNLASRLKRKGT
jgi:hypothetical protein